MRVRKIGGGLDRLLIVLANQTSKRHLSVETDCILKSSKRVASSRFGCLLERERHISKRKESTNRSRIDLERHFQASNHAIAWPHEGPVAAKSGVRSLVALP